MMRKIVCDKILSENGFFAGTVTFENGIITEISSKAEPSADGTEDYTGCILAPGFVELHVHGACGHDFAACTAKEAAQACDYHLRHGTTTIFPTVTSMSVKKTERALSVLSELIDRRLSRAVVAGVHLEGPYFSAAQCGAQNAERITPPIKEDYERILARYGKIIKRWSYAPERDRDEAFCRALVQNGVLPSMGHSDARYEDCVRAFAAGCRLVTHLYSCTSTVTRENGFRHGGIVEAAYENDEMFVEMIADGCHLPPELLRLIYKIKGAKRTCLITDAIAACGTNEKQTTVGDVPAIIEDGVAKLPDRTAFAGSIATQDRLVRTCVDVGIPLCDALRMASETPGTLMGLSVGKIQKGYRADFVLLNGELFTEAVFVGGKKEKE